MKRLNTLVAAALIVMVLRIIAPAAELIFSPLAVLLLILVGVEAIKRVVRHEA